MTNTESGARQAALGAGRRQRTRLERRQIVEQCLAAGASVPVVAAAHGVRASQVYHWRRLYRQGLLDDQAGTTALVPVKITDAKREPLNSIPARLPETRLSAAVPTVGAIHLELDKVQLRVEGAADPSSLRLVLEYLLR